MFPKCVCIPQAVYLISAVQEISTSGEVVFPHQSEIALQSVQINCTHKSLT